MARKKETAETNKRARFEAILKLVGEKEIGTQKDLVDALAEKGFDVTQATISRDIRELKLVKTALGQGRFAYRVSEAPATRQVSAAFYSLFETSVISVESAVNQVVIKTLNGMASAVCAGLDSLAWSEVLGTVAGDDTILVITVSEASAKTIAATLKGFM
ncbi:MAG: arginine repressor [Lachnospiraceae bacterium]|nr:arginine repressor [Lachnospiraceae bacterium]